MEDLKIETDFFH